jgi:hypothetical protein
MKVTKSQYDKAFKACILFSKKYPEFNKGASYPVNDESEATTEEGKVIQALDILDDSAGMWACNERTHYTESEFYAALSFIESKIGDFMTEPELPIVYEKGPAQTPADPLSQNSLKKYAKSLGLRDARDLTNKMIEEYKSKL